MNTDISGAVLAGGKSSRFGSNKALVRWDKKNVLIENVLDRLKSLFINNMIITKSSNEYRFLNTNPSLRIIEDSFKEYHSLGGIFTALKMAETEYVFICGCDMPFIEPELVKELERHKEGYDAVIPMNKGKLQPLTAIYSKQCIQIVKKMIDHEQFKIIDLFDKIKTFILNEDKVGKFDPKGLSFFDIDTIEDFKYANRYI